MCEHCRSIPHLNGCPMADDPPLFAYCQRCGGEIWLGEDYYKIDGIYCIDCVDDMRRTAE